MLLAAAALLCVPATASASTAELSGESLLVAADGGEHNALTVSRVFTGKRAVSQYQITEQGPDATLTPGDGCTDAGAPNQVFCPTEGTTSVSVNTLDLADRVFIQTIGITPIVTVLAGTGKDEVQGGDNTAETIRGGRGDDVLAAGGSLDTDPLDVLVGGAGRDTLSGQGGPDKLKAKDGERDKLIDCGDGDDPEARRDRGLDPRPVSC